MRGVNEAKESANAFQRLMGKLAGIGDDQEAMAAFFQRNGMHPSRAAQIMLNGVSQKPPPYFCRCRRQTDGPVPAPDAHPLRKVIPTYHCASDSVAQ